MIVPLSRSSRISTAALALLVLAASGANIPAQAPQAPTSAQSPTSASLSPSAPPASTDQDSRISELADNSPSAFDQARVTLSAAQIITILQERPQVVIELKTLLAEAQSQATPVQPDSITDEMLLSQITSSREVRENITIFLRARGYVSDEDFQRAAMDSSDRGRAYQPSPSFPTGSQMQRAGFTSANPLVPYEDGNMLPGDYAAGAASLQPRGTPMNALADIPQPRGNPARSAAEQPRVLRRPAPYNLLSLRDLYTQIPDSPEQLKRFGSDVFLNRARPTANPFASTPQSMPLDFPIGPDYVVGPGDGLTIDMWGGLSQTFTRIIAVDGHITLPESGDIQVAGLTLQRAQNVIETSLKRQYRDAQVAVTVSRLRTIRIYVVGDVQRPGSYEISSLSSPLNALYAAGGPTSVGSLRTLQHLRGKAHIGDVDLYDFLLHGANSGEDRLQGGDTLIVPASGPQVAVWGAVKRPAIYELKGETSLADLLSSAGGITATASLDHVAIERIGDNQHRETISFDLTAGNNEDETRRAMAGFPVKDGDRIHVAQIVPYSERVIYLEGHVVRPGRHPFHDGMRLNDVLQSYQDLLPEPAIQGEIVRLVPPDLHVQTINFSVPDALIGNANVPLQPFDTIRVLGRYEADAPKVEVRGEVLRPGSYPLSAGMTAAQLVRMAGGFKRDALLDDADLISYRVANGKKIEIQRADVRIGAAVQFGDNTADAELKPGDVLTVHQITGWNDIGASIAIEGEVAHPGSYGFQEGERLSDLLRRAGGFRDTAYPAGAVLTREQVRELEEKSRAELIRQIETSSAAARLSPNLAANSEQTSQLQMVQQQQEQILSRLKSQPATGRLVIHITSDIDSWAGTAADIEVRRGDVLKIPKRPGFVLVSGQVYNASAITFVPGKNAGWYLQRAGGSTSIANRKEIFVIRANGSVVGRRSGDWYDHDVLSTRMQPGDVVVVPQKVNGPSMLWRNLLITAQIASSIAITAAVAGL
jgi:protein involved in polysaccharide export with SLBB domain